MTRIVHFQLLDNITYNVGLLVGLHDYLLNLLLYILLHTKYIYTGVPYMLIHICIYLIYIYLSIYSKIIAISVNNLDILHAVIIFIIK